MKILIVGTGVIGSIYGKALSEQHDITHYVRQGKLELLHNKTIPYDLQDERLDGKHQFTTGSYTYKCTEQADDSYDFIFVPVQTHQLLSALTAISKQAPNASYVLLTLDWQNEKEIDQILRKDQYIFGYAGGGGTFKSNLLWANMGKDVMLGATCPEQGALLNKVTDAFKLCGFEPEIPANPLHWLWMHNISAAPFGVAMGGYSSVGALVKDKKMVKRSFAAMRECFEICEKRGVNLDQFGEFKMYKLPLSLVYLLFKLNFTLNPAMQRFTAHAMDSLEEMKRNFIEIYDSGKELGVTMPNMEALKGKLTA
jgi:ketopantoate reductase